MSDLYNILNTPTIKQPNVHRTKFDATKKASFKQSKNLSRMLEEQRKRLMREFKEKSDLGFLGDALDIVSVFTGPVGAAISQGIKSVAEMDKSQTAAKRLYGKASKGTSRFSKTFLKDDVENLLKESRSLKMGGSDMLKKLAGDVIGGYTSSVAGEGGELGKSLIEGITNPGEGKFWNQLKKSFNPEDYAKRKKDIAFGKLGLKEGGFGSNIVNKIKQWKPLEKMEGIEEILKDLKGFRDGFDLSELLNLDNKEEKGSSVPYDSQWI